jgi:hypothetical protein
MKTILCLLFAIHTLNAVSQTVRDFKQKTSENQTERTEILNLARNDIFSEFNQEVVFVVHYFKVCGNYAWFEGYVQRKDGEPMQFPDEAYDCCHAEGLFVKKNGHWTIAEFGSFSTDCWYCGISDRYPNVPKSIFKEGVHY